MTNLDSIFKSRDITLPIKVSLVKAMVFPVVMYGCESWTVKKAEHQRINAFELWCWRRLFGFLFFGVLFFFRGMHPIQMEKTLENPLDCKEVQPVHPKGDQSWVFTGRTDVESETTILWPPDANN